MNRRGWQTAVAGAIALTVSIGVFAAANVAAAAESAEQFLQKYFKAVSTAKTFAELEPLYTPMPVDEKTKDLMKDPMFSKIIMEGLKSEPAAVKVVSKAQKGERLVFELAPAVVPTAFASQAKSPTFSMQGQVVLVPSGDSWKVHKDYWTVKYADANGKSTTRFGRNPPDERTRDESDSDASIGTDKQSAGTTGSSLSKDYDSLFRDNLLKKWQRTGKGKLYTVMRVLPDGLVTDLQIGGETNQPEARAQLEKAILQSQPFPALPADKKETPIVWMFVDWNPEGHAISGPYFSEKSPQWVLDKIHGIADPK